LELTTLYAYLAYAIAFLFRPVGAVIFGTMGDIFGRKSALMGAMLLMSLATLGIALIPSYKDVGVLATVLFFLCRICQGLSVGGEYGAAMTYAFEMDIRLRTFFGACVISASHFGGVFASLLASGFSANFRFPFLIGGFLGLVLIFFRSSLKEKNFGHRRTAPELLKDTLRKGDSVLKAALIAAVMVFAFYGTLIYVNEWVYRNLKIERALIFRYNTCLLSLWVLIPPLIGFYIDKYRIDYKFVMYVGSLGMLLSAPFLSFSMISGNYAFLFASQVCFHIFLILFSLGTPRYFGELFRKDIRNTAVSSSYSLGASITSALAPLICHGFVVLLDSPKGLMIPLMTAGAAASWILSKSSVHPVILFAERKCNEQNK
jgi:MHS family proline/betaine transporter-like MFS transporter